MTQDAAGPSTSTPDAAVDGDILERLESQINDYASVRKMMGGPTGLNEKMLTDARDEIARLRTPSEKREPNPGLEAMAKELARLRAVEHAAWHLMDDSEERVSEGVIVVSRENYEALSALLPEDHPGSEL